MSPDILEESRFGADQKPDHVEHTNKDMNVWNTNRASDKRHYMVAIKSLPQEAGRFLSDF
jgi:hypothetical protein